MDSVQLNRLHIIETQYVKVKVIVEGDIPPNADAPARVSPHTNSRISYSILTPFMRKINVVKTTGREIRPLLAYYQIQSGLFSQYNPS